ncbi:MAG: GGDEF domain-containing protein [Bacilli bacterium]|nr:GGDEF domain-containing protein [Bacilli bacterium]
MTGLYNRYYFEELAQANRNTLVLPSTIISADCDKLKQINDRFGHAAGDQYILYARDAIQTALPEGSFLFRMGGDEFLAFLPGVDEEEASAYIERINENVTNYVNDDFALKLSVGGYTIKDKNTTIEKAYLYSDKAMYEVKRAHKSGC